MPTFKPSLSIIVLTIVNIVPLLGVIYLSWDATTIIVLYWAENLIIGFYNILKIAFLETKALLFNIRHFFPILFFCLHFVFFCIAHALLILLFFKVGGENSLFSSGDAWPQFILYFQSLISVVSTFWENRPQGMEVAFIGLFISHGFSFFQNYVLRKEYKSLNSAQLMLQPYKRVVKMHIAVIVVGSVILYFGSPVVLVAALVLLKIIIDIYLHIKEHRTRAIPNNEKSESRA